MSEAAHAVALHEAGHIVAMFGLGFGDLVCSATIVPEGDSLGYVSTSGNAQSTSGPRAHDAHDAHDTVRPRLLAGVCVSLEAGGAAERIAGYAATGCENDMRAAERAASVVFEMTDVLPQTWRWQARQIAE